MHELPGLYIYKEQFSGGIIVKNKLGRSHLSGQKIEDLQEVSL